MAGFSTNGIVAATGPLTGTERISADTGLAGGAYPQTEAVTVSQIQSAPQLLNSTNSAQTLTYAATVTPNSSAGWVQYILLAGAVTFAAPTNPAAGQEVTLIIQQDATGTRVATWNAAYTFPGGTKTLSTAANAVDMVRMVYDGVNAKWRCVLSLAFA